MLRLDQVPVFLKIDEIDSVWLWYFLLDQLEQHQVDLGGFFGVFTAHEKYPNYHSLSGRVESLVQQQRDKLGVLLEEPEDFRRKEFDKSEEDILDVSCLRLYVFLELVLLALIIGASDSLFELVGVVSDVGHYSQVTTLLECDGDAFSLD